MPDRPLTSPENLPASVLQTLLTETGVREFVICAGARNSALLVLLAAIPGVRLWHHFEERSAAFFALGRILDHECPVAVVTTSGTAVAELLPAVIEAHYQGLPLIALTADRPAAYRGTGAPQAIEQAGIFGCYPKIALDITNTESTQTLTTLTSWDFRGPLHLNLCLEEPTAAALPNLRAAGAALVCSRSYLKTVPSIPLPNPAEYPDPLLLIGDLLTSEIPAAEAFAAQLGAPIYAEAASGLRESAPLQNLLLQGGDNTLKNHPHRSVIRLGGVPACRFWRDLENRPEIPVLSYTRSHHPGLSRPSQVQNLHAPKTKPHPKNEPPPLWSADGLPPLSRAGLALRPDQSELPPLTTLHTAQTNDKPGPLPSPLTNPTPDQKTAASCLPQSGGKPSALQIDASPAHVQNTCPHLTHSLTAHPTSEPALIRALSKLIPDRAVLFTGNSLAIRQWNLCAQPLRPLHARALRGANGIDGNLSAFLGLAADAEEAWCLVGDLTALYDLAAPWMLAQLKTPRLRLVVIQNAGGKIFSRLPSLQGLTDFERQLMENPHRISLQGWAQQWGLAYQAYHGTLLENPTLPDHVVLEIYPDAEATEAFWKTWNSPPKCGPP